MAITKTAVKVFSTNESADLAGANLTKQIENWLESENPRPRITNQKLTSNPYGWMVSIIYEQFYP